MDGDKTNDVETEGREMNRQEAYEYLKDYLDNVFHNSNDYETYCYLRDCADTLAPPDPDPITGLVPCGCGGKAILFHQPDIEGPGSDGDRWAVFCEKTCGMETSDLTSREYAVEAWNTGMGHKGGAE